jgi:hypothetical protein
LVNFRLSPVFCQQLDELAERLGVSRGECAKTLVVESLSRGWLEGLQSRLEETDLRIVKLREDLATTLQIMLVEFAKEPPEKVEAWVKKHMRT